MVKVIVRDTPNSSDKSETILFAKKKSRRPLWIYNRTFYQWS